MIKPLHMFSFANQLACRVVCHCRCSLCLVSSLYYGGRFPEYRQASDLAHDFRCTFLLLRACSCRFGLRVSVLLVDWVQAYLLRLLCSFRDPMSLVLFPCIHEQLKPFKIGFDDFNSDALARCAAPEVRFVLGCLLVH